MAEKPSRGRSAPAGLRRTLSKALARAGWRLRPAAAPGSVERPLGELPPFLEDLAARGFVPRHILDVGANEGAWSRMAREAFSRASGLGEGHGPVFGPAAYTLVEPREEMAPELEAFCRETPGARWVRAGAGPAAGEAPFGVQADSSSFLMTAAEAEVMGAERRVVPVVTLDGLAAEAEARGEPSPDLVKLDVEGYELEVLEGADALLETAELLILEVALFPFREGQPSPDRVLAFLAERGFALYDIPWSLRRPLDGALALVDLAFARQGGRLRGSHRWSREEA